MLIPTRQDGTAPDPARSAARRFSGRGISGMGFYLPRERVSLAELAELSGTPERVAEYAGATCVRRAGVEEWPVDMAVAAAADALAAARLGAEDLDLVLWCGSAVPEYIMPTTAGSAQAALGARRANAFDLAQGCSTMLTALWAADSFLAADLDLRHVLLLGGDRWSSFTRHNVCDSVFFGDGAGAIVVSRDHPRLHLLAFQGVTRGEYSDLWRLESGGVRSRAGGATESNPDRDFYRVVDTERAHGEFKEIYVPFILETIQKVLEKARVGAADLAFVSMVNANLRVLQLVLDGLGIGENHSSADYLREYGHFGAPDVFFNLSLALGEGRLSPGDKVLLVSTGIGFHWVAAVVEC